MAPGNAPTGGAMREIAFASNSMSAATPARAAFSRDATIAPASRSEPRIGAGAAGRIWARASSSTFFHVGSWKLGQRMNAKLRVSPGGMRRAMSAPLIAIEPDDDERRLPRLIILLGAARHRGRDSRRLLHRLGDALSHRTGVIQARLAGGHAQTHG